MKTHIWALSERDLAPHTVFWINTLISLFSLSCDIKALPFGPTTQSELEVLYVEQQDLLL